MTLLENKVKQLQHSVDMETHAKVRMEGVDVCVCECGFSVRVGWTDVKCVTKKLWVQFLAIFALRTYLLNLLKFILVLFLAFR